MITLLILWALGGAPALTAPVTAKQTDGTWKCSAFCLTEGNADGGQCRTPLYSHKPSRDACEADLKSRCAKTKPPVGGCR